MDTKTLGGYLNRLEATSSRIEITKILAELFRKLDASEIDKVVYMLLGSLAPSYQSIVFNVAEAMMQRALARAYSKTPEEIKEKYKKYGDLGILAQELGSASGASLSALELYERLKEIAEAEGEGSQDLKIEKLSALLTSLDSVSARFVARIPIGKLRLGFSDKTVIDALSWMETGDKSKSKLIESAYQVVPDVGQLAVSVKKFGAEDASRNAAPRVGTPVIPMLAQRIKSPSEMIKKMGEVAIEPKFDGLRVQIHYQKGEPVRAFTRNLNDIKNMFPELDRIGDFLSVESAILDSEAVGLDKETMKMADFQTTMHRRRKHDIAGSAKATPLTFQVFDVMLSGGKNMMHNDYTKRREELAGIIQDNAVFVVDKHVLTRDPNEIAAKHQEYLDQGLEGALIKKANSHYVPGRTGWRWVKMKEIESANGKLADTVDCVVMGYTQGRGKRAVFGIGQFLAGIVDGNRIKTITKVGTGLTDEQFKELNKRLKKITVKYKPENYDVHKDLEPDFWVLPEVVVELAADELTVSPKHTAGMALRFPRLVDFRDDKSLGQATTLVEVKDLYKLQAK